MDSVRTRRSPAGVLAATGLLLVLMALAGAACGADTGPTVEFKPVSTIGAGTDSGPGPALAEIDEDVASNIGFIVGKEAIGLKNGGRVPLSDDKIAEVFLAPYPPDWQTDLHLFLLDGDSFEPIGDVDVDLEYDMVYMDHGIDAQTGTDLGGGHYVLPLSFLMYGDWNVDMAVDLPEGRKHLRFVVKFYP